MLALSIRFINRKIIGFRLKTIGHTFANEHSDPRGKMDLLSSRRLFAF